MSKTGSGGLTAGRFARVSTDVCVWVLVACLLAWWLDLLPFGLHGAVDTAAPVLAASGQLGWLLVGLAILGVFLTCLEYAVWAEYGGWLNFSEMVGSVAIALAAMAILFSILVG